MVKELIKEKEGQEVTVLEGMKKLEELNKAIDLQEELGNPYIMIHKPKNKKKIVEFDSDTAVFDIVENNVIFDFWEIEGFNVKMKDIKSVVFENAFTEMTIVHIELKNGNTVMLKFLPKQPVHDTIAKLL